jgi:hypothetical protein
MRTTTRRKKRSSEPKIDHRRELWMANSKLLALCCSLEIHGLRPESQEIDLFFLLSAADHVWATTRGDPCWTRLDVDAYFARHARHPDWSEGHKDSGVGTLLGFYTYLTRHGLLSAHDARPLFLALDAHVTAAMRDLGYVPLRERERTLLN